MLPGVNVSVPTANPVEAFNQQVINSAPDHWWKLDNDYTDSAGSHNAAARGSPTFATGLHAGSTHGLTTSDGGNYAGLGTTLYNSFVDEDAATIETVFKRTGANPEANAYLFITGLTNGSNGFGLGVFQDDDLFTIARNGNGTFVSVYAYDSVVLNTMHLVQAVIDPLNNTHRIYVDGASAASSTTLEMGEKAFDGYVASFLDGIGGHKSSASSDVKEFNGIIDDVILYKRELTSSEITAHYNALSGVQP